MAGHQAVTTGRFIIVGVGPGAPDLLTLKADRLLRSADVVAYPISGRSGFAADIARAAIGEAEHFGFAVPMSGDGAAEAAYDAAARTIGAHLDAGRTVALLCEGDPMLYGSAASIMARLAASHPAEIVPGVSALSACAAAAQKSLVRGNCPLTVLPATAPKASLRRALAGNGALAIYKVGRHFDAVAKLVRATNRKATLISHATLPDEVVTPLHQVPAGEKPYFTTILVEPPTLPLDTALPDVAVVALGASAVRVARRVAGALRETGQTVQVHGLARRVDGADVDALFADPPHHIAQLFGRGVAVVGICASGILIRAVAPLLSEKVAEPPVVAVSEDGAAVVPLLGGHNGGTTLARTIALALGTRPAITTRSEAVIGEALDDPPAGLVVADPLPFKEIAALAAVDAPPDLAAIERTTALALPPSPTARYIEQRVALGMGAERGADPDAAVALARRCLKQAGIDPRAVALVVSLDKKADEAALHAVAGALGVPFRVFSPEELATEAGRLARPSSVVEACVGVPGVAEAAALAAAGENADLRLPKTVDGKLTCAIAEAPSAIAPGVGRAQGHLAVVGIGPGAPSWRTREVTDVLARADAFVGYSLYLDLVDDLRQGRPRFDYPLGDETERCQFALEHAAEGRTVALVSSGDAGIYAMASLVAELLHQGDLSDGAKRVALTVCPGVSAAQAAAARAGAPLGHDFAFVSLSDLLTPWAAIRRRLEAVATADFVVALYNPRSRRRTAQLEEAAAIFRAARPAETPVMIAESLSRPAEAIHYTNLKAFDPAAVHMLATVIIGASSTKSFVRGDGSTLVYTPRGYGVGT